MFGSKDSLPCEILYGYPAPYSGTLMTEGTVRALVDKAFEVDRLNVRLDTLEKLRLADKKSSDELVTKLKVQIEDAPGPFYESPWFWLGAIGAFAGGVALGVSLSK